MPSTPRLADPGALIRAGRLATTEVRVCLDPDLVAEHEDLAERRDAAKAAARDSLAGGGVAELDQQIAELIERMEDSTITLVLQALPQPKFRALCDKHPVRKDADGKALHQRDVMLGVAYEPFFHELLPVSIVEPKLEAADLELLLTERLSDGQWDDLTTEAWNLNRRKISVPFSQAVSRKTRTS